ncbi:hypothetical protein [Desulfofustis limnaeus]|uniref:hypothetical protein n=1 Tax=Desulfofustis limnaeus TaxID=2740163 RepID=UPI0024DF5375|nr:hypothetical protein [Desulfofustis limnaeus]
MKQNDEDKEPHKDGVITTQEELEGFLIVRAILHEVVDVSRVVHRDTKSYFGILLDDNNRKPLCRLHFNTAQKYIGLIGPDKSETRYPIQGINEIYNFSKQIKETLERYNIEQQAS